MESLSLRGPEFWVDCRCIENEDRWVAVCDDAADLTVGYGHSAREALLMALAAYGETAERLTDGHLGENRGSR
jgi:hypothetical protein